MEYVDTLYICYLTGENGKIIRFRYDTITILKKDSIGKLLEGCIATDWKVARRKGWKCGNVDITIEF